jgi:hypothetical protein
MKATHYSQVEKAWLTSKVFMRKYPHVYYVENGATDPNQRYNVQVDNIYKPNEAKRVEK